MSATTVVACCCGGEPPVVDCCDMQSCPNFVAPTSIVIQYSGVITRTFSTGQSVVLADYSYTLASDSAFIERGDNCSGDAPREFGSETATLEYEFNAYSWVPEINNQSYLDPLPWPCSSCDASMNCDWNGLHCLQRKDTYSGASRVVSGDNLLFPTGCCQGRVVGKAPPVLRYLCCDTCGCARPTILYTPTTTIWATEDDLYTIDDQLCCYATPPPGPVTAPGTWVFDAFTISGRCGCPGASTWNSPPGPYTDPSCPPLPVVPGYAAFGIIGCPSSDCSGLAQNVVADTNTTTYYWQCQVSGFPDPVVINFCEATVSWTDVCTHTVTVTVT